jgi:hypothetical protein
VSELSQLSKLSKLSKPYISHVKNGTRPVSDKLNQSLGVMEKAETSKKRSDVNKAIEQFLKSRRDGISNNTIIFYRNPLNKAIQVLGLPVCFVKLELIP